MEKIYVVQEIDKYTGLSEIVYANKTMDSCTEWIKNYLTSHPALINGYSYLVQELIVGGFPTYSAYYDKERLLTLTQLNEEDI